MAPRRYVVLGRRAREACDGDDVELRFLGIRCVARCGGGGGCCIKDLLTVFVSPFTFQLLRNRSLSPGPPILGTLDRGIALVPHLYHGGCRQWH